MPKKVNNILGQKFSMLKVISRHGQKIKKDGTKGVILWMCRCDCGKDVLAHSSQLKRGEKTSCGCKKRHKRKPRPDVSERNKLNKTHGLTKSSTYSTWKGMKSRCLNKNDKDYKNYGGRGIAVCEKWINSFESFLNDMGERPNKHTLDRIDVNGDYSPENCRWATQKIQSNNTRFNRYVTYKGVTRTASEWAREVGLEEKTLAYRLRVGWDVERALTTPSLIKRK